MRHVQRVATARVVHVVPLVVGHETVVGGVVDAPEGEGGPEVVPLRGVVVDHVEDDLDPRLVKGLDHGLELGHLLSRSSRRRQPGMRREEADRVVPPVVRELAVDELLVGDRVVYGQELHRRDAKMAQVFDGAGRGQPRVRAPQGARDLRVPGRESLDVQLVDDGLVPRRPGAAILSPPEGRIDGHRPRHVWSAVAVIRREISGGIAELVAEERGMPCQGPRDRLGIRVEEELGRIEAVPVLGLVRPVHPVAVQEAGPRLGQVDVPHLVRLLLHADPVALALRILGIEQAEVHGRRVLAEEREIDTRAVPGRPERVGHTWPPAQRRLG